MKNVNLNEMTIMDFVKEMNSSDIETNLEIVDSYELAIEDLKDRVSIEEVEALKTLKANLKVDDFAELCKSLDDIIGLQNVEILDFSKMVQDIVNHDIDSSLLECDSLDESVETLEELLNHIDSFELTVEVMMEKNIFSYSRLKEIASNSNLDDSVAAPALLLALDNYPNAGTAVDYVWEVGKNIINLGTSKAIAAKDWYFETSGIDHSILAQIDDDLVIDWETSFDDMFNDSITIEFNGSLYKYN